MSRESKRNIRLLLTVLGIFVALSTYPGIASGFEGRGPDPKCGTCSFPSDSASRSPERSRRRFSLGGQLGGFYSLSQVGANTRFWYKSIGADVSFMHSEDPTLNHPKIIEFGK